MAYLPFCTASVSILFPASVDTIGISNWIDHTNGSPAFMLVGTSVHVRVRLRLRLSTLRRHVGIVIFVADGSYYSVVKNFHDRT